MNQIKQSLTSETIVKKSKFLGFAFLIKQESDIKKIVLDLNKQHKNARHVVYAYRLSDNNVLKEKFDNNKEPVNSAGKPLLYLLQKKDVINCLLVVIRYFGGTKLGVGGLVRAYTKAGQIVLENNLIEHGRENTKS
jgi:uncharacterized YigZ family protein